MKLIQWVQPKQSLVDGGDQKDIAMLSWLVSIFRQRKNHGIVGYAIFPNEILAKIAIFLDTPTLLSLRSVCKCFFYLALDRRYRVVNTQGMVQSSFAHLCRRMRDPVVSPRVTELKLSFEFMMTRDMFASMLDSVITHLTNVTSVTYGRLPRLSCVSSWATFGSNLRSLTVITYMNSVDDLALELLSAPLLEEFHFHSNNDFYSTTPGAMQNVIADFINRHAPSLKVLEINSDFSAFIAHLVALPALETFALGGEYELPAPELLRRFLCDNCPNLKHCGIWLLKEQMHHHLVDQEWKWLIPTDGNPSLLDHFPLLSRLELSVTDVTVTDFAIDLIARCCLTLNYLNISNLCLTSDQLEKLCQGLRHSPENLILKTLCIRVEFLSPQSINCLSTNLFALDTLRLRYNDIGDEASRVGKAFFLSAISDLDLTSWRISHFDLHRIGAGDTRCRVVSPVDSVQARLLSMIPSLHSQKILSPFIENVAES